MTEPSLDRGGREAPEAGHGQVREDFEATGFMAPFVVVRRRSDNQQDSLTFQASPRFSFDFQPHHR